ncbi:MAG: glycoside hydrolase family 16 [Bacteroidales bacterium]
MTIRIFSSLLLILIYVTGNGFLKYKNYQGEELLSVMQKFNNSPLGPNVFIFEPDMNIKEIQAVIDTLFLRQSTRRSEFSNNRYAVMFKPGVYDLDIRVDYYMQVMGLGDSPKDVVIKGAIRSNTTHGNSVLTNFWRAVENMTIVPLENSTMVWGVSQAAPLRRVYIKGNLQLFDRGYASGGFLADSKVEGKITSGPQQQWLTRNSSFEKWEGGVWNMMFVGVPEAPDENWPEKPYTVIGSTPVIREKPVLVYSKKGFCVKIPAIKTNITGPGWLNDEKPEKTILINRFYIVKPEKDNARTINAALKTGKNILFTPGRYYLSESLLVNEPGTVIMGTGMATLIPENGNMVMEISDVDGVIVCGLTFDAGTVYSEKLFMVGEPGSEKRHQANPVFLYDLFFRVGGHAQGSASVCLVVNSNDVVIDHIWLWRADHGNGVGWDKNKGANGIIVNGDNVTIYGLFNEHFQEYQTLWNGENGKVYFYQSEMPYDPPSVDAWKHNEVYGYASYKVADHVKTHEAWGLGIYNVFYDAPVMVDNAIETPEHLEDHIHNKIIYWLNGNRESVVRSIINGKGGQIDVNNRKAAMK